jgi:hypothetical protein
VAAAASEQSKKVFACFGSPAGCASARLLVTQTPPCG